MHPEFMDALDDPYGKVPDLNGAAGGSSTGKRAAEETIHDASGKRAKAAT